MTEEKKVTTYKIKYYGVFDLKKLVNSMRGFLEDGNYDVAEQWYKQKATPEGKFVEIKIYAERYETVHVQMIVNSLIRIHDLNDVEVVREGEKVKMQQGTIELQVDGKIILDYEERFEDKRFLKGLQHIYHTYIIAEDVKGKYLTPMRKKLIKLRQLIFETLEFEARA